MSKVKVGTNWFDADTLQCFHDAKLIGEAFFNGGQWIFVYRDDDGDVDHQRGQDYIEIDPDHEAALRRDVESIAAEPDPTRRAVLDAELKGRRAMYRDDEENRDLVRIRAIQLARTRVRERRGR